MVARCLRASIVAACVLAASPASATSIGLNLGLSAPFGGFANHPSSGAGIPENTSFFGPGGRLGLTLRFETPEGPGWRWDLAGSLHSTGGYEAVAKEAGVPTSAYAQGVMVGLGQDWGNLTPAGRFFWGASVLVWFPRAGETYAGTSVEYFRTYRNGPGVALRLGFEKPVGERLDVGVEGGFEFAVPGLLPVGGGLVPVSLFQLSFVARYHPGGRP